MIIDTKKSIYCLRVKLDFIILCLLLVMAPPALADIKPIQKPTALEEKISTKERQTDKDKIITVSVENDLFGGGTDENYTSGVRLTYMDIHADIPNFVEHIIKTIPTIRVNDTTNVYYSLGHNIYTPEDITTSTLSDSDRPYAAWLYGSVGMTTITDNRHDELEASIGIVGDLAFGEEIQTAVHHIVDGDDPKGWDNQIKNEPGLILSWQRSWPSYKNYNAFNYDIHMSPHIGATVGNIYTYGNAGASISIAPNTQSFQHNPVRVRPAIPGSGYYDLPSNGLGWYIFGGIDMRAIARNIFLDGNSFKNSLSVNKEYFVTDLNGGVALTYNDIRLSYSLNYRTKEYSTQTNNQIFGSLSLSRRF